MLVHYLIELIERVRYRRQEKLDTLVDSVPKVALIVDAVKKELDAAGGMTPRSLAGSVVRNASPAAVENLINSPIMCWNLVRHPLHLHMCT